MRTSLGLTAERPAASPLPSTGNETRYNRTTAGWAIIKPLVAETNAVLAAPPRWVADQGGRLDPSTSLRIFTESFRDRDRGQHGKAFDDCSSVITGTAPTARDQGQVREPGRGDGHGIPGALQRCRRQGRAGVMAETQAVYYRERTGHEPVDAFIAALPARKAAKIDFYDERYLNGQPVAAPPVGYPITSQVRGELRELRVRFANTYFRVLYQRSDNLQVLLHAFEKDTRQLPEAEIKIAERRFADFKARMDAAPRVPPRAAGHDAPASRR